MKKIFIPTPLGEIITIPSETTHHLVTVFRHPLDKPITVSDESGRTGIYQISEIVDGEAIAHLLNWVDTDDSNIEVVLVQSFLKGEKFELVLQKATELGVTKIYSCATNHCVAQYDAKKLKAKETRWQKILQEAAQQCGRPTLPELEVNLTLAQICKQEKDALCIVAYENEEDKSLKQILQEELPKDSNRIVIFIGPEGGFGEREVVDLEEEGVLAATLGKNILRAETAAISAVAMIQYEVNL